MGDSAETTSLVERGDDPELSHTSALQAAVTSVSSILSQCPPDIESHDYHVRDVSVCTWSGWEEVSIDFVAIFVNKRILVSSTECGLQLINSLPGFRPGGEVPFDPEIIDQVAYWMSPKVIVQVTYHLRMTNAAIFHIPMCHVNFVKINKNRNFGLVYSCQLTSLSKTGACGVIVVCCCRCVGDVETLVAERDGVENDWELVKLCTEWEDERGDRECWVAEEKGGWEEGKDIPCPSGFFTSEKPYLGYSFNTLGARGRGNTVAQSPDKDSHDKEKKNTMTTAAIKVTAPSSARKAFILPLSPHAPLALWKNRPVQHGVGGY